MIVLSDYNVWLIQNAQQKASVLFVDRCLDLASVVGHHRDCIMDKVITMLPRLPGHTNDIAIDMSPVCLLNRYHITNSRLLFSKYLYIWKKIMVILLLYNDFVFTISENMHHLLPTVVLHHQSLAQVLIYWMILLQVNQR